MRLMVGQVQTCFDWYYITYIDKVRQYEIQRVAQNLHITCWNQHPLEFYTSVYLRRKDTPLLEYNPYPNCLELEGKSQEEKERIHKEISEYNEKVSESYGCCLFFLSTTPSRELEDAMPWTSKPEPLNVELLDQVLAFYD